MERIGCGFAHIVVHRRTPVCAGARANGAGRASRRPLPELFARHLHVVTLQASPYGARISHPCPISLDE
jgi:hypothetical protein